jgi:hypothetical protein
LSFDIAPEHLHRVEIGRIAGRRIPPAANCSGWPGTLS